MIAHFDKIITAMELIGNTCWAVIVLPFSISSPLVIHCRRFHTIYQLSFEWNLTDDLEKQKGTFFFAASCFVHNFIAISEFKLELQSKNAQFGSKSIIFCPVCLWNLTDDFENTLGHLFYATSSFVHYFVANGEFKLGLQSGNAKFGSKSTIF